jgi:hypothetical protein
MTNLAKYTFLPWLRQGLSNSITTNDTDPSVKIRAAINVEINVQGQKLDGTFVNQTVPNPVMIYGPGDIIGIEQKAIIKAEPRNWITNFEANYFPYIEFYDEDFAWRYTPAAPQGNRLRPWITLVVLLDDEVKEFEDGKMGIDQPLPFFNLKAGVKTADVFPSYKQLWAWAHVHVNGDLSAGVKEPKNDVVVNNLEKTLKDDPDNGYCRIVCPRRLEPLKGYQAFLIPTFETGRLAGLGNAIPAATLANQSAWGGTQSSFPYYHRWYFRTGTKGDFEYLVGLLQPKTVDPRVGTRDMDVVHPGSNLPIINTPAKLHGILKLGGALQIPQALQDQTLKDYEDWDEKPYPHPFEEAMAARINLEDDYAALEPSIANPGGDPDPIITSPLYGRWHAAVNRLLVERDKTTDIPNNRNWVHELNLDPRFRVAAGMGTSVVQKYQEDYMQSCWEQIGDVLSINNKIILAQLAKEVSDTFYQKHFLSLTVDKKMLFTAPLQKRIVTNGLTVFSHVQSSTIPHAATTAAFRRLIRPGGVLLKRIPSDVPIKAESIITGLNESTLVAAPPKTAPAGAIKLADALTNAAPQNIPAFIRDLLTKQPLARFIPLISAITLLLLALLTGGAALIFIIVLIAILAGAYFLLNSWYKAIKNADAMSEKNQTVAAVDAMPFNPNFVITKPGDPATNFTPGSFDSVEAQRFKQGLRDAYSFISIDFPEPVKTRLNLPQFTDSITAALNPQVTIPARMLAGIYLPIHIRERLVEEFAPVMNYPKIDAPMYWPLSKISSELFLPNINLVENNSITLLEMNERFIEAYMVGLNHEMSRELMWREYPTDQRGSYFRQFWDVSSVYPGNPPPADIKDKLRDIKELHTWPKTALLGKNSNRPTPGDKPPIVLVIRGELLKKYPTAVIYAHKADWAKDKNNKPDATIDRVLATLTIAEEKDPPKSKIRTPMFEAKVDPDIYFFGFDLDAIVVKGGTKTSEDAGWFFVIKERPTEPRFGLDEVDEVPGLPKLFNWNKFSWEHTGTLPGKVLQINQTWPIVPQPPPPPPPAKATPVKEEDKKESEDEAAKWNPDTDAAQLAYILYQVPMMVEVHGSRMLPPKA